LISLSRYSEVMRVPGLRATLAILLFLQERTASFAHAAAVSTLLAGGVVWVGLRN